MGGMTFTNGLGGLSGIGMSCHECGTSLESDDATGNYRCPKPGCGKGGISSPDGIKTTVDEQGNVKLSSRGKAPSAD
jgi:hypothetical protein